jgi:antitoxin ParD1/3/4
VPTRNISLTREQDEFVEQVVGSGDYQNASEAVRDALRLLQLRRQEDALKLDALRLQISAGLQALERGDFVELNDEQLESYFDRLIDDSSNSP